MKKKNFKKLFLFFCLLIIVVLRVTVFTSTEENNNFVYNSGGNQILYNDHNSLIGNENYTDFSGNSSSHSSSQTNNLNASSQIVTSSSTTSSFSSFKSGNNNGELAYAYNGESNDSYNNYSLAPRSGYNEAGSSIGMSIGNVFNPASKKENKNKKISSNATFAGRTIGNNSESNISNDQIAGPPTVPPEVPVPLDNGTIFIILGCVLLGFFQIFYKNYYPSAKTPL